MDVQQFLRRGRGKMKLRCFTSQLTFSITFGVWIFSNHSSWKNIFQPLQENGKWKKASLGLPERRLPDLWTHNLVIHYGHGKDWGPKIGVQRLGSKDQGPKIQVQRSGFKNRGPKIGVQKSGSKN